MDVVLARSPLQLRNIYHIRRKQRLTLEALSALTGIHRGTLNDFENLKGGLTIQSLEKLSHCLGCSVDDLIRRVEVTRKLRGKAASFSS